MRTGISAATAVLTLTVLAGATLLDTQRPAAAWEPSPYPWCAYISAPQGGWNQCGFVTFEQCLATISGVGGRCFENPSYVPPEGYYPARRKKRRAY